ncbi:hypothetical protein Cs7R123_08480 [Catellatospora sp. TT07R-123]|uniref:hypothetical protein n=1 Tax=Catellatospora sp. TT07R-123 TaxID=2733863 RepID=UPI001AFDFAED|nr:hypothetical protein [Catellatospora sp. TT07R-123]GHJ43506.1 hypothetical protein Cs7R123_08480 [Catellatospora sp. TT07R-123]
MFGRDLGYRKGIGMADETIASLALAAFTLAVGVRGWLVTRLPGSGAALPSAAQARGARSSRSVSGAGLRGLVRRRVLAGSLGRRQRSARWAVHAAGVS